MKCKPILLSTSPILKRHFVRRGTLHSSLRIFKLNFKFVLHYQIEVISRLIKLPFMFRKTTCDPAQVHPPSRAIIKSTPSKNRYKPRNGIPCPPLMSCNKKCILNKNKNTACIIPELSLCVSAFFEPYSGS